jgi:putative ABC transport system permease protein
VRLTDMLGLPVAALWQQKMRTMLTTLGVVFGAFVLAASLSIGQGVQETIDRESHRSDVSRRVDVYTKWNVAPAKSETAEIKVEGKLNDARRERIRRTLVEIQTTMSGTQVRVGITRERLEQLAAIPHVERAIPLVSTGGFALHEKSSAPVNVASARPDDEKLRQRLVAGRFFDRADDRTVVLDESTAYNWGLVNDSDIDGLVGQTMRLEFRFNRPQPGFGLYIFRPKGGPATREETALIEKIRARLPEGLEKLGLSEPEAKLMRKAVEGQPTKEPETYTEDFTIVGIVRRPTEAENKGGWDPLRVDANVIVPYKTAVDMAFRIPAGDEEQALNMAVVIVDNEANVKDVVKHVAELGLEPRAAVEFIDRERLIYLLIFGGMTCVAAVALLVSALGIANTMLMSVLERTREIGIMKSVGADNRHLQLIFLIEGALIGLLGAGLGLLLAYAASFPGDAWVRSMVERDLKIELTGSIFVFPPWMALAVVFFTIVVTTLAALYPARHAARIDPVAALRHE